jgi:hypothetical protein
MSPSDSHTPYIDLIRKNLGIKWVGIGVEVGSCDHNTWISSVDGDAEMQIKVIRNWGLYNIKRAEAFNVLTES